MLNIWFAKFAVIGSILGYMIIRWPHGNLSRKTKIVDDRKGGLENSLLSIATVAVLIFPVLWLTTSLFSAADYSLYVAPYLLGLLITVLGLWVFHRSHADLGKNWSVTLQMRENHNLITTGIYSKIRHPMYTSMFLLALAQLLVLPNWIAGPSYLIGFGILYLLRVQIEERMMLETFGSEYQEYMKRTGRLLPSNLFWD